MSYQRYDEYAISLTVGTVGNSREPKPVQTPPPELLIGVGERVTLRIRSLTRSANMSLMITDKKDVIAQLAVATRMVERLAVTAPTGEAASRERRDELGSGPGVGACQTLASSSVLARAAQSSIAMSLNASRASVRCSSARTRSLVRR